MTDRRSPTRRRGARALGAGAAATVLLVAGACTASSDPEPAASAGTGTSASVSTPEASEAAAFPEALRPTIADTVDRLHLPGAFVLVTTPEGTFAESFGNREEGVAAPLSATDQYRIGSITKTMTATVILQLVGEGEISLDDPVSTYVDGVPNGDRVTVRQLLNMTSGLPEYTNTEQFNDALLADPQRAWTPQELLAIAFDPASTREPGAPTPKAGEYFYDNTNYVLLGLIIEEVTGTSASDALRTRIFEPLGMSDTRLPAPDDATLPDPHGHGYVFGLPPEPDRAVDATGWNPSWAWTAGSVVSTPEDMAVYAEALTGGQLLPVDLQEQRLHGTDFVDVGGDAS